MSKNITSQLKNYVLSLQTCYDNRMQASKEKTILWNIFHVHVLEIICVNHGYHAFINQLIMWIDLL